MPFSQALKTLLIIVVEAVTRGLRKSSHFTMRVNEILVADDEPWVTSCH